MAAMDAVRLPVVGVMGSGQDPHAELAAPLGRALAGMGVHLLTGGGGGVMASVMEAFVSEPRPGGGLAIGVLPSRPGRPPGALPEGYPNPFAEILVRTHLPARGGDGADPGSRNHINVLTSDVVVALPGGEGTASEIGLARAYGIPVVALGPGRDAWPALPDGVSVVSEVGDALAFVRRHLGERGS